MKRAKSKRTRLERTNIGLTIRSFHLVADKIAEADYFLVQMDKCASEFDTFRFNYSAFASAARSITFVLQSVLHDVSGFSEWYAERQAVTRPPRLVTSNTEGGRN